MNTEAWIKSAWRVDAAGVGLVALVTLIVWPIGVEPIVSTGSALQRDGAALDVVQGEIKETQARLSDTSARGRSVRAALDASRGDLEPTSRANAVRAEVLALAERHALSVAGVEIGTPVLGTRVDEHPWQLNGTGNIGDCVAFLGALSAARRDTRVRTVRLSGNAEDPTPRAAFQLEIVWYASPLPRVEGSRTGVRAGAQGAERAGPTSRASGSAGAEASVGAASAGPR
jgi:hypothetical protein